jgi:hypothetical protein
VVKEDEFTEICRDSLQGNVWLLLLMGSYKILHKEEENVWGGGGGMDILQ